MRSTHLLHKECRYEIEEEIKRLRSISPKTGQLKKSIDMKIEAYQWVLADPRGIVVAV